MRVRIHEKHRRRQRKQKLACLKERYRTARSEGERKRILEKVTRVAPSVTGEQFLASTRQPRQP